MRVISYDEAIVSTEDVTVVAGHLIRSDIHFVFCSCGRSVPVMPTQGPGRRIGKILVQAIPEAIRIRGNAHAVASRFKVGAALVVVDPLEYKIYSGCNVENEIYVVTHAEQAAIAHMIAECGSESQPKIGVVVIALVAENEGEHALPCGLCRQVLREFCAPETRIYGVRLAQNGATILGIEETTLGELLPHAFVFQPT